MNVCRAIVLWSLLFVWLDTADGETMCYESSVNQEVMGGDCTLLNMCKFSGEVANVTFVYSYFLVNASGIPDEEYTVKYYLDELQPECLQISKCCKGICNDTSNPLSGHTFLGTLDSGPSYSLYACNMHSHSAFLEGQSHFEFDFVDTSSSSAAWDTWWLFLILASIFFCIFLLLVSCFIFRKVRGKRHIDLFHENSSQSYLVM